MSDPDYDDYDSDDADPCDHEQADVDILSGRAHCHRCGHAWWLTSDELKAEIAWQAQQYETMVEEYEADSALASHETKEG